MLQTHPPGRHLVEVCTNVSCSLSGGDQLDYLKQKLALPAGAGSTTDGRYTLREVECLGSCGTAPAMIVDEEMYEQLDIAEGGRHPRGAQVSETLILTKRWGKPNSAALTTYRADGGYAALDKALGLEPGRHRRRGEEVEPARPRRRRLRRPASSGPSCPRTSGPATSRSTPTSPSPAPSRTATSSSTTRTCSSRASRSRCYALDIHLAYIYIRGEFAEAGADPREGHRGGPRGRHPRQAAPRQEGLRRSTSTCTAARARTSAARRRRCSTRSRASAASRASSRRSRRWSGLFGKPTIVNNVETIANVPWIVANGGDGSPRSASASRAARASSASPAT